MQRTLLRHHEGCQLHLNSSTRLKPGSGALHRSRPPLDAILISGLTRRKVCVRSRRRAAHVVQAGRQDPPTPENPPPSNSPVEWVQQQAQAVAQAFRSSEASRVLTHALESSGVNALLPPAAQPYAVPIIVASATVEAALLLLVVRKVVGGWFKSKMQEEGRADAEGNPGVSEQLGSAVAAAVGVPQEELEATIQGAAQSKRELQRLREQVKQAQIATEAMQERLKTQLSHREEELSKALKTAAALQEELNNVQSVVLVREKELDDVQAVALKKADEAKAALKESQRKVALLEAMVYALRGKLLEEEEKNAQLTKAVKARDLKISSLESQRTELVGRVEELKAQLGARQDQLKEAVDRSTALESQVQQLEAQSKTLQAKVNRLESRLQQQAEEARQAAFSAEERLAVLQAQATEGEQARMKATMVVEQSEREVQELRKKVQSQSATIRDKAEQAAELRQQVAESESELRRKEDELDKARVLAQQLVERLDELARERAAELESVRTRLQRELMSTQRKSDETQAELNMVKKELFSVMMKLLGSVDDATDALQKLPSELKQLLSPEARDHEAHRHSRHRVEALQKARLETQKKLAGLRESVVPRLSPHMRNNLAQAEEKLLALNKNLQNTLSDPKATPVKKRRAERDVQQAEADVEALYRSAMPLDVRQQDRNLRAQLRDQELELSTLTAEWVAENGQSAALGELLAQKLQAEAEVREAGLKERLKQNEEDLQRWKQSEQQLREQISQLEQSWKDELAAVQQSLGSNNTTSPASANDEVMSKQALKIVVELRAVRDQLQQQAEQVKTLRSLYADRVQGAQANAEKARGQVTLLSDSVAKLESELQQHESKVQKLRTVVGLPGPSSAPTGTETIEVEVTPVDTPGATDAGTSATEGTTAASSAPAAPPTSPTSPASPADEGTRPKGTVPAASWGRAPDNAGSATTSTTASTTSSSPTPSSAFANEEQLAKEVQSLAQSILGTAFGTFKPPTKDPSTPPSTASTATQPPPTFSSTNGTSAPASPSPSKPSNGAAPPASLNGSSSPTPTTSRPTSNGVASKSSTAGAVRPSGGSPVPSGSGRGGASTSTSPGASKGGVAVAVETKVLKLVAAGCSLPSDAKVDKGGEDAHFVSPTGLGAIGVADGVGGWMQEGVDPALYAQGLMKSCEEILLEASKKGQQLATVDLLEHAQRSISLPGSSTICVAVLRPEGLLEVANLGDSGMRLIRGGKCLFATDVLEHQFNMPYQMACPDIVRETDTAADAELYNVQLQSGDVVILGSDGLFDNMWDEQLEEVITKHVSSRPLNSEGAEELSRHIANTALQNARNANFRSPWAVEAARLGLVPILQRMFPRGGKMDDITAVVAFVDAS